MKLHLLFLLLLLSACHSENDTSFSSLNMKQQQVINSCLSCHSQGQKSGAPRLEGLEGWYMEEQVESFYQGKRGTDVANKEANLMHNAMKLFKEDELYMAVEWFAAQKKPTENLTVIGDSAAGSKRYKDNCFLGKMMTRSPELSTYDDWYLLAQLNKFDAGLRGNNDKDGHGNKMRLAIQGKYQEQDFKDIIAFLKNK